MAVDDRRLSPYTGWTRDHWADRADRMLLALRRYASPDHARIDLPGPSSLHGRDSDALEAFARSFLLAAIRLRGESGRDPHGFVGWYVSGLRAGTDPNSATAWPRPDLLDQSKVEAASIALGLSLSRSWLWDRLTVAEQEPVVDWLGAVVRRSYPPINWVWFQIVVETFLRSVGGPWAQADIDRGVAVHEALYRGDGWYSDGTGRAYDHYGGWALHLYPLLWADMAGELCPDDLRMAWRDRLARFLDDAARLVGHDGSPLLQGRSLIYRFAAAAPFWVGALTGATNLSPGLTRRVCSGMLRHFDEHGAPDDRGLLTLGWHHAWPRMAQSYSGPGSPYWAAHGMLGLAVAADHPVWTAVEEPLPVERSDTLRAMPVPGWLVSGTRADGLVRVINHGTDHSTPGDQRADSPLYARLGYSTSTLPPLGPAAAANPADNSVTLVDATGRAAHRNGFEPIDCHLAGDAGVAVSRAHLHWVDTAADHSPDHGSGRSGPVCAGPMVTVGSVMRGAVEVRAVRVESSDGLVGDEVLEVSGWPVADDDAPVARSAGDPLRCTVVGGGWASELVAVRRFRSMSVRRQVDTSPLAEYVAVPVLRSAGPPRVGAVHVCIVVLRGDGVDAAIPAVRVDVDPDDDRVSIRWADGTRSRLVLPRPPSVAATPLSSPG